MVIENVCHFDTGSQKNTVKLRFLSVVCQGLFTTLQYQTVEVCCSFSPHPPLCILDTKDLICCCSFLTSWQSPFVFPEPPTSLVFRREVYLFIFRLCVRLVLKRCLPIYSLHYPSGLSIRLCFHLRKTDEDVLGCTLSQSQPTDQNMVCDIYPLYTPRIIVLLLPSQRLVYFEYIIMLSGICLGCILWFHPPINPPYNKIPGLEADLFKLDRNGELQARPCVVVEICDCWVKVCCVSYTRSIYAVC